jgi:hypothetical protein
MFLRTKLTFTGLSLGLLTRLAPSPRRNSRNLQLRIKPRGPQRPAHLAAEKVGVSVAAPDRPATSDQGC